MSTNFYLRGSFSDDPETHLGKRVSGRFLWAMDSGVAKAKAADALCPCCGKPFDDGKAIQNEYGETFDWDGFQKEIEGLEMDYKSSGTRFC